MAEKTLLLGDDGADRQSNASHKSHAITFLGLVGMGFFWISGTPTAIHHVKKSLVRIN